MNRIQEADKHRNCLSTRQTNNTVKVVFISLLIDLLAFTMILPLFPSLMDYYRKVDGPDGLYASCLSLISTFKNFVGAPDRYTSVLFGGFLGSMYSFLQFLASPIVGGFSDVYGRKPVLLVSLVGIAFSYLIWTVSYNFKLFVLSRIIGGLSKGNVSLLMAVVTDVSSPSNRTSCMALIGIAFSLGFLIGPVIGAAFATSAIGFVNWFSLPAFFALTLALSDIAYVVIRFKETLPKEQRSRSVFQTVGQALWYVSPNALFNFKPVLDLSSSDRAQLKSLGQIYFIYLLLYSGLEFTLTFFCHHKFGYTAAQQGGMFFFIGFVMAIIQAVWVRSIPQSQVRPVAVKGLLLIIPSFFLIAFAINEFIFYLGLFLFAVSTSVCVTCITSLASHFGKLEQKGTVIGVFRSLGALARAIGPILASTAYWCLGSTLTYSLGAFGLIWPWYVLKYNWKNEKIN